MSAKNIIYKMVAEQKLSPKDAALILKQMNEGEKINEDIAIIGISGRFPGARNVQEYWENLRNGKNCIGAFPEYRRQDTDPFLPESLKMLDEPYLTGGYLDEIDKFDATFFRISPKEAKWMHPTQRLFLTASWEAIEDAGYSPDKISGTRTGVYVGVDQTFKMDYGASTGEHDSTTVTGSWTGILSGRLSYILNLQGPSVVVDTACSSGLVAVHMACKALKNNECELAIAGGISIFLLPIKNNTLSMLESKVNKVRAFEKNSDGTVWGEGVCSFLLKPLSKALADRDNIYAVIKGSAVNNNGASSAITSLNAEAQEELITRAWEDARIDPETIAYIEAHGTGTILGDPIEVKGLTMAFERYTDKKQFCAIGSLKTNIGHLVGASGTASLLKVILILKNKEIPPVINFNEPNPYINFCNTPLYINDTLTGRDDGDVPLRAGINSFGFSGTNCHMVIEEAPRISVDSDSKEGKPYIFVLSAKSEGSFQNLIKRYIDFMNTDTALSLRDICYTAATGRGHYNYRLAMVVKSRQDLKHMLELIWSAGLKQPEEKGFYYRVHKIIPENKESKGADEITEREKNRLSQKAAEELERLQETASLEEICSLYVQGADIDWKYIYKGLAARRVSLPLYPFEQVRHWTGNKPGKENKAPQPERIQKNNIKLSGRNSGEYTEKEKQIAHVWGSVLEIDELDIHDSFYELGGDSVQAIKISNIIRENTGKDITISDIFEHLTIKNLALHLEEMYSGTELQHESAKGIEIVEGTPYDLSHAQERMWFLQRFEPNLVAYNIPSSTLLNEALDIDILTKAFELVAQRHPALRTIFVEEDGFPKQIILKNSKPRIELVDLSSFDNNVQILEKSLHSDNRTVFDLSKQTFLLKVYKLDSLKYCVYFNCHHIIMDGWSAVIFRKELMQAYIACSTGAEPDWMPLKLSYIDLVFRQKDWIRSEKFAHTEKYWLNELSKPIPVLNLPTDYSRPQIQTFDGSFVKFRIDKSGTAKLKELSKGLNSTLFILFLSAYYALLNRITSDEDIIVGTIIAGRDEKEHENIIGLLMNSLCIRINFDGIDTFKQLLDSVKTKSYLAFRNSRYPFDLLVSKVNPERDLSRSPIFSTVFQFYESIPNENENVSQFDLSVLCKEIDSEIEVRFEYNSNIFKTESIERLWNYYRNILEQVQENPHRKISEIELLSQADKECLLNSFSSVDEKIEHYLTMHEIFEHKAKEVPEAIALIYENDTLTYRELNERANHLAHRLRNEGIKPDEPVGIMMQRGINTVVGMIGILKAGGAYVPLDPAYPPARVGYMLEHSEARIVVTEAALLGRMDELMKEGSHVETVINLNDMDTKETADLSSRVSSDNLMYIIYTSGSTGLPKGVMVTHKNAVNYIRWSVDDGKLGTDDRMLLVTSISFDISVFEIFGALTSGATLVIASEDRLKDPGLLLEYIEAKGVNVWHSVPTLMAQLLIAIQGRGKKDGLKALASMRRIMIGGEAWSVELAKEIRRSFKNAEIVNMYGPTEATIWVTSYKIGDELEKLTSIPIGRPISNNSVIILDSYGKLCPIGVQGDIYICGANVTKGYYKDNVKTSEVFIYNEEMQAIIYRTGDMGKYLDNGSIEYLGRKDGMVKVRGYRIEVGEIENVLLAREDINHAAVVAMKAGDTNKLVCFYVSDVLPSIDELKGYLKEKLPEYMVPSNFVQLDSMPLTPNGKYNRKLLAATDISGRPQLESEFLEPVSEVEKYLAGIWKELLGTDRIGVYDNFFSLGGNSFLVTQMHSRIEKKYPDRLKIVDIFKYPTISTLSQYINEVGGEKGNTTDLAIDEKILSLFDNMENGEISIDEMVSNLEKIGG